MFSQLAHAPRIGAAVAFGLIATGIAVSESLTWDSPVPQMQAPEIADFGPPMPSDVADDKPKAKVVNLADAEAVDSEEVNLNTAVGAPEIALRMLYGTGEDLAVEQPVEIAEPTEVRTIELPRRDDELDALGRPVDTPDQYELAALPSPENAPETTEQISPIDENLVAPIPAPAYRRPIVSYLVEADFVDPPVTDSSSLDPFVTGNVSAYQSPYPAEFQTPFTVDDNWPRRLDQVVTVQGQASVIDQLSADNLFLGDWVEVREGGRSRVVAQ